MDKLSRAQRSEIMVRVRSTDTRPEVFVRKLIYGLGYHYRLHGKDLPGHPDIVFRKCAKVIFVHGCFWHRHAGCTLARLPKSRLDFWMPKLQGNRKRDERSKRELQQMGWKVLIVWECQLKRPVILAGRIRRFLDA